MENPELKEYELEGLKIEGYKLDKFPRVVEYDLFAIATDSMGTQICKNGIFFGGDFEDIESAIAWLKTGNNLQECIDYYKSNPEPPTMGEAIFNILCKVWSNPENFKGL